MPSIADLTRMDFVMRKKSILQEGFARFSVLLSAKQTQKMLNRTIWGLKVEGWSLHLTERPKNNLTFLVTYFCTVQ